MPHFYVADWIKAVGDDPAKQEKARERLKGLKITYKTFGLWKGYADEEAELVDVDFKNGSIECDRFLAGKLTMSSFEIRSYKPRFANEPPTLPE